MPFIDENNLAFSIDTLLCNVKKAKKEIVIFQNTSLYQVSIEGCQII
jgi:hypothetical protein